MPDTLKFRISSGLKNIIGKELIVNDNIAIFELVKNSYDAYAKNVKIVFKNIKEQKKGAPSKILIVDNGNGMSYKDLETKWLFVGYSDKKDFEKQLNLKTDYRNQLQSRRIFAGAKGVGRFSCDRLGKKLILYTKKEEELFIHRLDLDWEEFERDQGDEFQTIDVNYLKIDHLPKEFSAINNFSVNDFTHGTILEIADLNTRNWDPKKLLQLKNYLQRLINPTAIGSTPDIEIELIASEFEDEDKHSKKGELDKINGVIKNIVFEKLGIKTTEINCSIDNTGKKIVTELIDKGEFIFRFEEINEFPLLKNINAKIFYLNPEAKATFTKIMGIQPINFGSIFLYKNMFRIHPYGDGGNDWLGLETRKTQGYARYLSARELMGRIEILGYQPKFKEVSSRDGGIVASDEFDQLLTFFRKKVLRRLERYVVEVLAWDASPKKISDIYEESLKLINEIVEQSTDSHKKIDFNPDLIRIYQEKQSKKLPKLVENIEYLLPFVTNTGKRKELQNYLKTLRNAIITTESEKEELKHELDVVKKQALFTESVLTNDKEIKVRLSHSIKNTTFNIEDVIKDINHKIKNKCNIADIIPDIDEININNQKIRMLSKIVKFATFETKVEKINKDIISFISEYINKISAYSQEIKNEISVGDIEFKKKFNPLEISIVLDNLFSNSRKAGASKVKLIFKKQNDQLHLFFSDNGKGINDKDQKYIFTRGYSTTDGDGLGLYDTKKILTENASEIKFIGNGHEGSESGACFEVIFK